MKRPGANRPGARRADVSAPPADPEVESDVPAGVHPDSHALDQRVRARMRELDAPESDYLRVFQQVMREDAMSVTINRRARGMTTLDRTGVEFRLEVGPWKRGRLYRLGRALYAAGAADTEDAAHDLVWHALQANPQAPARESLEVAGVDVTAVERHLRDIEAAWTEQLYEEQLESKRYFTRVYERSRTRPRSAVA